MIARRSLMTAVAALTVTDGTSCLAAPRVTVIYVSAWDCGPCRTWTSRYWDQFKESAEFGKLRWVKIDSPRIKAAYEDRYWPAELRRYRDEAELKSGVPRWLVIKDDRLVFRGRGQVSTWPSWPDDVLPAIKAALAEA